MNVDWLALLEKVRAGLVPPTLTFLTQAVGEITQEEMPEVIALTNNMAQYALAKAQGIPGAEQTMAHLEAQAVALGARLEVRTGRQVTELVKTYAKVGGEIAFFLVKVFLGLPS